MAGVLFCFQCLPESSGSLQKSLQKLNLGEPLFLHRCSEMCTLECMSVCMYKSVKPEDPSIVQLPPHLSGRRSSPIQTAIHLSVCCCVMCTIPCCRWSTTTLSVYLISTKSAAITHVYLCCVCPTATKLHATLNLYPWLFFRVLELS